MMISGNKTVLVPLLAGALACCCGGAGAATWTGYVVDGYRCGAIPTDSGPLVGKGIVNDIRYDDDNATNARTCYSAKGFTIVAKKWLSAYFDSTLPPSTITSVKLRVQHQGQFAGESGSLYIHVSTNKSVTQWYSGNTNNSDAVSAPYSWNNVEQTAEYDVTGILNTPEKVNNCEMLLINSNAASYRLYYDYAEIVVVFDYIFSLQMGNLSGATDVLTNSATLNGQVESGAPPPDVRIYWGASDAGPTTGGWERCEIMGTRAQGATFSTNVTGLIANQAYYYRCYGTNSSDEDWSDTAACFTAAPPAVAFSITNSSGLESVGAVPLTLSLSCSSAVPVTVYCAPAGGTASNGTDYFLSVGAVIFPPGSLSSNILLSVTNDSLCENNETVTIAITGTVNAARGAYSNHVYTILDNDPQPTVSFVNPPFSVLENAASVQIGISLSAKSGRETTVDYGAATNTATAGADYTNVSGRLTWPPGNSDTKIVTIPIVNDDETEGMETFLLILSNAVNCDVLGAATQTVTIVDDDMGAPVIDNGAGASGVTSNSAVLNGFLSSTGGMPTKVWIYWGPSDCETNKGSWYRQEYLGYRTIGPVSTNIAGLATNTPYFYRCYASNDYGGGGAWAEATTNFLTGPPTIQFAWTSSNRVEADGPFEVRIKLSGPSTYGLPVSVKYSSVAGGTASNGSDFILAPGTATVSVGASYTNITVDIPDDQDDEYDEDFGIAISNPVNGVLGSSTNFVHTILDDDPPPTVFFTNTPYQVAEGGGSVSIDVRLSRRSCKTVSVDYATSDGSAEAGADYTNTFGTLVWTPGQTGVKSFSVPVIDNTDQSGDAVFYVTLSNTGNCTIAGGSVTNVTIQEDDVDKPVVTNDGGPSNVLWTTATLNGYMAPVYPSASAYVYWGPTDGGSNRTAWSNETPMGSTPGFFRLDVEGLVAGTEYRYRCYATNAIGECWAPEAAVFTTLPPAVAGVNNYYVNDGSAAGDLYCLGTGDDGNPGTNRSAPKATIQNVLDSYDLEPGDVIWIDAGTYILAYQILIAAEDCGAPGDCVVWRGATGPVGSVLDGDEYYPDYLIEMNKPGDGYVRFENISLTGAGYHGIYVYGSSPQNCRGVEIVGCRAYSSWDSGIYLQYCSDALVERNSCWDNYFAGIRLQYCANPVVAWNEAMSHVAAGYHAITVFDGIGGSVVSNRCCFNDGAIYYRNDGGLILGNECSSNNSVGLYIPSSAFVEVRENVIRANGSHGIQALGRNGQTFRNNLLYDNGGYNILLYDVSNDVVIENNTIAGGGGGISFAGARTVTNRNNIVWASGSGKLAMNVPSLPLVWVSEHNNLYATDGANVGNWTGTPCATLPDWRTASSNDLLSISADPSFVNSDSGDYHLQSPAGSYHGGLWICDPETSPCIDAGDPWLDFEEEPAYNGLTLNQGAYGNSPQASKTPYPGGQFYSIALSADPASAGCALIWPRAEDYPTNRMVTISAAATNALAEWRHWTGSVNTVTVTNSFLVGEDMVVTAVFGYLTWTVDATADPGGWISPCGIVPVEHGSNIVFDIGTAGVQYTVSGLIVDGTQEPPTNSWTFLNVTNDHTIHVLITAPATTTQGTPYAWLADYGITTDQEVKDLQDPDKDGAPTWQEFQAGTVPTNPNSVFKVIAVAVRSGSNCVTWYATTNSGVTTHCYIYRGTNLRDATTWPLFASNLQRSATGTNTWWDTNISSPRSLYFYKPGLTATNQ